MPHQTVIATNGQTLTVNASVSHWTSAALAAAASGTNDVESTTTTTITSDYSLFFADTATTATITVKQLDGTTLWADTVQVGPGVGTRRIAPVPDRFQVAADAVNDGRLRVIKSGRYYSPGAGVPSTTAAGTGVMTLIPFWSPHTFAANKLAVSVTTGAGSAVVRLGIYGANSTTDEPSTLLLDAGTVDGSGTAVVEATIDYTFTEGLYYLAAVSQVASATLRTVGVGGLPFIPGSSASNILGPNANNCYYVSSITGALADVTSPSIGSAGYKVAIGAV